MEDQDIFNQFKKAADNAESPDFASMEKVWNRVEERLDKKELKKATNLWKKWAVAASVLLGISIGYQFLKEEQSPNKVNKIITQQDSVPNTIIKSKEAIVATDFINPAIKKEADAILNEQITIANQVALEETISTKEDNNIRPDADKEVNKTLLNPIPQATQGYLNTEKHEARSVKLKEVEVFMNKENKVSNTKKEEPLLVYDDLVKDKQSVKSVNADDIESIVILNEPLYIINGIQYTEQELFGPNPTSPYAPLNKQEIDSISILQDEKAVSIYGEKGKKGVVIISTKNGKPVDKKANKSILNIIEKSKK